MALADLCGQSLVLEIQRLQKQHSKRWRQRSDVSTGVYPIAWESSFLTEVVAEVEMYYRMGHEWVILASLSRSCHVLFDRSRTSESLYAPD